ncbi:hypothetical protein FHR22_001257 [Sphingopyxis panaciterrae]|uniref:hypothetical protein n=1 Tax=Sphingopyxis panaciterrae TaxID=363841 RepID=UPI001ABA6175|nr:hypothetical protein [Sphingopyxis panaciterrae]NIJ36608.1 hypothetical protein [Sphingopyxis panaciterrae]
MVDSFSSPGIDLPSPTLSARLDELVQYLAAPAAGRLTEEQRALSLGIARRLVTEVAARLRGEVDAAALWRDWMQSGLPGAGRLATTCFARAEEHRWREQSAQRASPPPMPDMGSDAAVVDMASLAAGDPLPDAEQAYLNLQIADRRRFDAVGNPAIAIAGLDAELFRSLLLDIAAWRLVQAGNDDRFAAALGETVREALARQADEAGIDQAARAYHDILAADAAGLADVAATAIARHDWPTVTALAAAAHRRPYGDMVLALLAAEAAALPSLLAPLKVARAALAPLEASLAMLPDRAVNGGGAAEDDYATLLRSRAGASGSPLEQKR